MKVAPFLFIRHGETDWNLEGRLQGGKDVGLNATGRCQAEEAGQGVAAFHARHAITPSQAAFVASPLQRARDTMAAVRTVLGLEPSAFAVDERLRELSFGAWEGLTWAEVKARDPGRLRDRRRDTWRFVPPDGESYAMLADRIRDWLDTLQEERLVVVAHGGVARVLMVLVGGLSTLAAPSTDVPQGRVLHFTGRSYAWL